MTHPHLFIPATEGAAGAATVVTLHGTGGDEHQFAFLHEALGGKWNLLAPRGQVREHGANRYFRRLAEGVFDMDDLHARSNALGTFIQAAAAQYGFRLNDAALFGYSNGANIAGAMLLRGDVQVGKAVLLHTMVPFQPETAPKLAGTRILITQGHSDPTMPAGHAEQVETLYHSTGAALEVRWYATGHGLGPQEMQDAIAFLRA